MKCFFTDSRRYLLFSTKSIHIVFGVVLSDSVSSMKGRINPPNCTILDTWVFYNFTLAVKFFPKVLGSLAASASVCNDLCGKLISSLESSLAFDEVFKNP